MPRRNKGPRLHWRVDKDIWEIRWFEHGRKRSKSTGTGKRGEAEKALAEFIVGNVRPIGPSDPAYRKLSDVLGDYADEHGPHVSSPATLGYSIDALIPYWGSKTVQEVNEVTCRGYNRIRQDSGVKPGTVARELNVLSAAINHDWKQGRVLRNAPIWRPKTPKRKERWMSRKEVADLLRQAKRIPMNKGGEHMRLFILLSLYTAARKSAILELRWHQIDLDRGIIDLNPPGREQTSKTRPVISISKRLNTFLRYAKRRSGTDTGYLFTWRGRPIRDIKKSFHATACKAGFVTGWERSDKIARHVTKEGYKVTFVHPITDVTPHVMRHSMISWIIAKGVSAQKVARFVGHSDSRITEAIYFHHDPEYFADVMAAMGRVS